MRILHKDDIHSRIEITFIISSSPNEKGVQTSSVNFFGNHGTDKWSSAGRENNVRSLISPSYVLNALNVLNVRVVQERADPMITAELPSHFEYRLCADHKTDPSKPLLKRVRHIDSGFLLLFAILVVLFQRPSHCSVMQSTHRIISWTQHSAT